MITLPLGAILTIGIFFLSMGMGNLHLYFNMHSLILVGGGTVAILFFSTPSSVLGALGREISVLLKKMPHFSDVKDELSKIAQNRHASIVTTDELTSYARELWIQGVSQDLFVVLLSQKKMEIEKRSVDSIQCLKNLAKYPPALGMAGTVMGIVTLFQGLEAGKDKIGPALALALTATFFGLAIANAIVMPLSDRLQVRHLALKQYLSNVYQVLLLINQEEAAELIRDEVHLRAN
jgi:chemotaxis protein MotA